MIKYLLVIAVVLVAFYIWRHNRRVEAQQEAEREHAERQRRTRRPPAAPDAMVTCRHCGLHLPASEAIKGSLGYYCGQEHRRFAEG